MGDYVSANGRSFPALLVMLEIDGTSHIHKRALSHTYAAQWMEECLSGLLSWTGSVKDGETRKGRGQGTKIDERKKTKTACRYCSLSFLESVAALFFCVLSNSDRKTKMSIAQAKTVFYDLQKVWKSWISFHCTYTTKNLICTPKYSVQATFSVYYYLYIFYIYYFTSLFRLCIVSIGNLKVG